eukprot:TRINITY_DN6330_c0_g1_i2.p1 TRINITY_DN6330_c0_g1~~TRINITY_DN6330_c0_g1_i2.p1  ORF type:complete len:118 (-),score=31.98 TRINITY_DN6330_c0_g1_i2:367-720(-)
MWTSSFVEMGKRKKRQESGDSLTGSSGYGSAAESFNSEYILNEEEAGIILRLNQAKGCPLQQCKNASRGCLVKTFPRILGLHEQFCKFPEVRKLTVRSKLNFFKAHGEKFNIFLPVF